MLPTRVARRFTDSETGEELVAIPLAKDRGEAILSATDWDRLNALGLTTNWCLNGANGRQYVRAPVDTIGKLVTVSRAIAGAGQDQIVRYVDGNPLNLRRENLVVTRGRARRKDAEVIRRATGGVPFIQQTDPDATLQALIAESQKAELRIEEGPEGGSYRRSLLPMSMRLDTRRSW